MLKDNFDRRFRYLRLSVTEACNFRCVYCLPDGYRRQGRHDFLSVEEAGRVARAFRAAGVTKIRITGGEPSVRRDLPELIAAVAQSGVPKVAMTTNGWALERDLDRWRDAGLTHLNVSVDSFDPAVFRAVTGHDRLASIIRGIQRALATGMAVKINAVLMRDNCGNGFDDFAAFLADHAVAIRFIELMRTADNAEFFARQHLPGSGLRAWLGARGWQEQPRGADDGPAFEFTHPAAHGRFGLIAPYAPGFCEGCNRLRVTARGQLRLCLFGESGVDLRDLLAEDGQEGALLARVRAGLGIKPAGHRLVEGLVGDTRNLSAYGG